MACYCCIVGSVTCVAGLVGVLLNAVVVVESACCGCVWLLLLGAHVVAGDIRVAMMVIPKRQVATWYLARWNGVLAAVVVIHPLLAVTRGRCDHHEAGI